MFVNAPASTQDPSAGFELEQSLINDVQTGAPLLEGMGAFHFPVSTDSELAQRYVDQGMVLAYGFNHAEAARSFRAAHQLDPDCLMAYWGEAWVLGPNINAPMDDANVAPAWAALQQALEHLDDGTKREQDYVRALETRYAAEPVKDRKPLDAAFAEAMRKVATTYPDDYDAQIIFAESLMNLNPWNYWEGDEPAANTLEVLGILERVLARAPDHPQANHLYIHAVEEPHPEWAEACADRLDGLCPGAGHLVHMPSHIYIRLGRYGDAVDINEMAAEADNTYVTQCHAQGLYPVAYMPHNHHFIWFGCCMQGRSVRAMEAACHIADHVDQDLMRQPGFVVLQHFRMIPLYTMIRFGEWEPILHEPEPAEDLKYPRGVWHYARGLARVRMGDVDAAKEELQTLSAIAADDALGQMFTMQTNSVQALLKVGEQVLKGEIAATEKDHERAIEHLRKAAELEDALVYEEPQGWYAPTRLTLGAVLLESGRADDAETIFREDLAKYPRNAWGLFGLKQALEAQGRMDEAARVAEEFEREWKHADVELKAARF
jgi:tetratricopeptide (TPR) repeat protein